MNKKRSSLLDNFGHPVMRMVGGASLLTFSGSALCASGSAPGPTPTLTVTVLYGLAFIVIAIALFAPCVFGGWRLFSRRGKASGKADAPPAKGRGGKTTAAQRARSVLRSDASAPALSAQDPAVNLTGISQCPLPAAVVDRDGQVIEHNASFAAMFGLTGGDGRLAEPYLSAFWHPFFDRFEASGSETDTTRLDTPSGERRCIRLYGHRTHAHQDSVFVVAQDRTSEHLRALTSDRELFSYRQICSHDSVLLASLDEHLTFTYVNDAALSWFGVKPEEVFGKGLVRLFGSHAAAEVRSHFAYALSGHATSYEQVVGNGSEPDRWLRVCLFPIRRDAEVRGVAVQGIDISAFRDAEHAALAGLDLREALIQASPSGVMLWDARGRLLLSNARARDLLGERVSADDLRLLGEQGDTADIGAQDGGPALRVTFSHPGDEDNAMLAAHIDDVSRSVEALSTARAMALNDATSGLGSRQSAVDALAALAESGEHPRPAAVIRIVSDLSEPAEADRAVARCGTGILSCQSDAVRSHRWFHIQQGIFLGIGEGVEADSRQACEELLAVLADDDRGMVLRAASVDLTDALTTGPYAALAAALGTVGDGAPAAVGDESEDGESLSEMIGNLSFSYQPEYDNAGNLIACRPQDDEDRPIAIGSGISGVGSHLSDEAVLRKIHRELLAPDSADGFPADAVVSLRISDDAWTEEGIAALADLIAGVGISPSRLRLEADFAGFDSQTRSERLYASMRAARKAGMEVSLVIDGENMPDLEDLGEVDVSEIVFSGRLVDKLPDSYAVMTARALAAYVEVLKTAFAAESVSDRERGDFLVRIGVRRFYGTPIHLEAAREAANA